MSPHTESGKSTMATECDWCGSLRLNGTTVLKTAEGFVEKRDYNPAAENQRALCRSCAKEALGIE